MRLPCSVSSSHPLGQHLHHDRCRRHRQRTAQRKRAGEPDVEVAADHPARYKRHRDRQYDLRRSEAKHDAPHRLQLRKRKLEANRKHQKHDAELGQIARVRAVGQQLQARAGRPECRRSDRRAAAADADRRKTTTPATTQNSSNSANSRPDVITSADRTRDRAQSKSRARKKLRCIIAGPHKFNVRDLSQPCCDSRRTRACA